MTEKRMITEHQGEGQIDFDIATLKANLETARSVGDHVKTDKIEKQIILLEDSIILYDLADIGDMPFNMTESFVVNALKTHIDIVSFDPVIQTELVCHLPAIELIDIAKSPGSETYDQVATNLGRIILSALAQAFNSQGVYP